MTVPAIPPEQTDLMQKELGALVEAWCDRGVGYVDAFAAVCGWCVVVLAVSGETYRAFEPTARALWERFSDKSRADVAALQSDNEFSAAISALVDGFRSGKIRLETFEELAMKCAADRAAEVVAEAAANRPPGKSS